MTRPAEVHREPPCIHQRVADQVPFAEEQQDQQLSLQRAGETGSAPDHAPPVRVDDALLETLAERAWREVDHPQFVGIVHHLIGNALPHRRAGDVLDNRSRVRSRSRRVEGQGRRGTNGSARVTPTT